MAAGPTEILAGLGALAARIQPLGLALGAPLAAAGLAALTIGTRHRRVLAVAGLGAVGALAGAALSDLVAAHLGVSAGPAVVVLAGAGGVAGALVPAAFPFAAAALPGAIAGAQLPLAGRAAFGAAAGALAAGIVGLLLVAGRRRGRGVPRRRRRRRARAPRLPPGEPPRAGAGDAPRGRRRVRAGGGDRRRGAAALDAGYVSGGPSSSKSGISALSHSRSRAVSFASIWRARSRVSLNRSPTSWSVSGASPSAGSSRFSKM